MISERGTLQVFQRCIGKKSDGSQCDKVASTDPPNEAHPNWPYLCPQCANEPARRASRNTQGIVQEIKLRGII